MIFEIDIVPELQRSSYFRGNPVGVLHGVAVLAEARRWPAGEVLAALGAPPEMIVVLVGGSVEVRRLGPKGQERISAQLTTGMIFGHLGVVADTPIEATWVAGDSGAAGIVWPKAMARRLLDDEGAAGSTFRRALILALSGQLQAANDFLRGQLDDPGSDGLEETSAHLQRGS